jgi:hypothetical protein
MNQMIVHTCFNNQSYHGVKSSVLKSGICKYTRRNEPDKMKWCVIEMARFNEHPNGQGLVTNLINRLKVLVMEEISFHETGMVYYLILLLKWYDQERSQYRFLETFCDNVFVCKRNRYVSYQNCCWRNVDYKHDDITEGHMKSFVKEGDTEELIKIGNKLIHYLEKKDERIFACYKEMILLENQGKRYRRKDPGYLWFEILETHMKSDMKHFIFQFALDQYHKKNMTERHAFAIWIGLMVWKSELLTEPYPEAPFMVPTNETTWSYINSMGPMKIDDYVINDYHVNSHKYGLGKFALEGALVIDEYLEFDERAKQKKDLYILEKKMKDETKKEKKKKQPIKQNSDVLEFIDWSEFSDVNILEEGVCGGKVCCIKATYQEKPYILKEMRESMNYGLDYILIDKCKPLFGLRDMNMKRIKSNQGQLKINPTKKSYVSNVKIGEKECVYCMMDYWPNIGDLGKHKDIMKDESVKREALKIRLFDGLFRSSDNIPRNILVNESNQLLSIDEGDIFGKRDKIFNKNDWFTKNCSEEFIRSVVEELVSFQGLQEIKQLFEKYQFMNYDEFKTRYHNYMNIVMSEL